MCFFINWWSRNTLPVMSWDEHVRPLADSLAPSGQWSEAKLQGFVTDGQMWINIHGSSLIFAVPNGLCYRQWTDICILHACSSWSRPCTCNISMLTYFLLTLWKHFSPFCFLKLLNRCCFDCTARLSSSLFCCPHYCGFPHCGMKKDYLILQPVPSFRLAAVAI